MKMACLAVPFLLIAQAYAAPKMAALIVDGQNNHDWKTL